MSDESTLSRLMARLKIATAISKINRWPAGAPGQKGGQFAPEKGGSGGGKKTTDNWFDDGPASGGMKDWFSGSSQGAKAPWALGAPKPAWSKGHDYNPVAPPPPPPGAKPHPHTDDNGKPVTINYPTKASDPSSWADPKAVATFTPGGAAPEVLNGVAVKPWADAPKTDAEWKAVAGQNPALDADLPFEPAIGKGIGAGVIIQEPDGRVWLTRPTNSFGGYQNTFPKGTVEGTDSLQASAIREAFEETGLQVRIVDVAGDYERTTSKARYYIAERVGGTPADMGWESQAMRLVPRQHLNKLLNMPVDHDIVADLDDQDFFKAGKGGKPKSGSYNPDQPRWPGGTPLGGQWMAYDAAGLVKPPSIGSAANPGHQKKADALYAMAAAGDLAGVASLASEMKAKADANLSAGKANSQAKWHAQATQYALKLAEGGAAMPKIEATADRLTGPMKLSSMKQADSKPGGSNPGAIYTDSKGEKWLVKGNAKYGQGQVTASVSDARAKNEILAAKLLQAVGVGAPDMRLVDLQGKHDGEKSGPGSLGVASKWVGGVTNFNSNSPGHIAAIRKDYAAHVWLGNYDVLGMGYDNTVIKDGKAINIDTGGAILFRAQGLPKDSFGKDASEWETMRVMTAEQKKVFGGMTSSMLAESAAALALISDDTIKSLVATYGPDKADLADTLIARRDAILKKAGVALGAPITPGVPEVKEAAPPTPPKVTAPASVNTGSPVPIVEPDFGGGKFSAFYIKKVAEAKAAHAAGDATALMNVGLNKDKSAPVWPVDKDGNPVSPNGKLLKPYLDALMADLKGKQDAVSAAAASGTIAVAGKDGSAWVADTAGVMQPVVAAAPAAKALSTPAIAKIMGQIYDYDVTVDYVRNLLGAPAVGALSQLVHAAEKGDYDAAQAVEVESYGLKKTIEFKSAILSAMTAPEAKQASPVISLNAEKLAAIMNEAMGFGASGAQWTADDVIADIPVGSFTENSTFGAMFAYAQKGDLDGVKKVVAFTDGKKKVKTAIIAAMTGGVAPAAAIEKPPSGLHKTAIIHAFNIATDEVSWNSAGWTTAKIEDAMAGKVNGSPIGKVIAAAAKGDVAGVIGPTGAGAEGLMLTALQAKLHDAMSEPVAPAAGATASTPETAPQPAPKVPTGAMPDFDSLAMTSGTNAAAFNSKLSKIKAAALAGNEAAILAMPFGVNTPNKQALKIANDALAALGSVHKVMAGQPAGGHIALVGGSAAAVAAQASPAPQPAPAKPKRNLADMQDKDLPPAPDMQNYNGNGKPYSSKPWKNEANAAALAAIKAAAMSGGVAAVKALTFPALDPETGVPTGGTVTAETHPATKIVVAYAIDAMNAVEDFLNPPPPLHEFNAQQAATVAEAAKAFVSKPFLSKVAHQQKTEQFGFWVALGSATPTSNLTAGLKMAQMKMPEYNEGKLSYKKYAASTKKYIDYVQQSGSINRAIDKGEETYGSLKLRDVVKQIYKDATPLAPGTTITRWQEMPAGMLKQLAAAPAGLVFQTGGGMCASQSTTATKHFGTHRMNIHAAPGAKALHSHGSPKGSGGGAPNSAGFAGEYEVTIVPGQRFVLLGKKEYSPGKWEMDVLMLPLDENYVGA